MPAGAANMSEKHMQPKFSEVQVVEVVKRLYRLTPSEIRSLPSYNDQNFYVMVSEGAEYILKIMNSEDSRDLSLIDVQTCAMSFLNQKGLPTQTVLPTISGELMSLEETDCGYGCQKYLVRMLTYLPGIPIAKVPLTSQLLFETGKMTARLDGILKELAHPDLGVLQRENFIWSLSNITLLEQYMNVLDGDPLQDVVKSVLQQFKSSVLPNLSNFRKGINHGDLNDYNLLVQPDESGVNRISGILDFGDMSSGYLVYELAITIMYMMMEHPNPVEVGGHVLAGWESVLPLNKIEKDCLYVLVLSRFAQSLVLGRYSVTLNPENEEYLLVTSKNGIRILTQLWQFGKQQIDNVWF